MHAKIFKTWLTPVLLWGTTAMAALAQGNYEKCLTCDRDLDEAKQYYSLGDLQQLVEKSDANLSTCLTNKCFSREKSVEVHRLMTEVHLYNNSIEKADERFKQLLMKNPLYEVDSVDKTASYDFIYLSRTYRRNPIISVYGGMGVNYTRPEVLQIYGADNTVWPASDYSKFIVGVNACIGLELPLMRGFDLLVEGNFALRTYRRMDTMYVNTNANNAGTQLDASTNPDKFPFATLRFAETQSYIDVPVMIRYNYEWKKKILPYAYVGGAPNFLLSARMVNLQRTNSVDERGGGQVVGADINTLLLTQRTLPVGTAPDAAKYNDNSLRNGINFSLLAGVGCKFRVERNFVFFDIRYSRFMLNSVNTANRYTNKELLYRYGYVDNDYRIDNLMLTVGFMKSFYKPRKGRQYDPKRAERVLDRAAKKAGKVLKGDLDALSNDMRNTTDQAVTEEYRASIRNQKQSLLQQVRSGQTTTREAAKQMRNPR